MQNGSIIGGSGAGNTVSDSGGGIYNKSGTMTVDGSTVSANTASSGGGIYNNSYLNVLNNSTIGGIDAGNTATSGGGGIHNRAGTTMLNNSTVSANSANSGGGILNDGTLNVQNGSIIGGAGAGNKAPFGGGIDNGFDAATTVDGSTISANQSLIDGGGIFNRSTLTIQNGSTVGGSGAGNTAGDDGGGIYNEAGTVTVVSSTVSDNTAKFGGGIWSHPGEMGGNFNEAAMTTVDGSTVSENTATAGGGGIYNETTLTIQNKSAISNNTADDGGGIYTAFSSKATVDSSTINANAASNGGGIYNHGSAITTVASSSVSANSAIIDGGGIFIAGGKTTMTSSRILNNTADGEGGGIYNDYNAAAAASVTGSCIAGNSDHAFLNNKPAQQIATGNWWGAAAGPNTPGADTSGGNVDVSGYLTTPILDCGLPDLQVNKANDTAGKGEVGTPFNWTLTISNSGVAGATFATTQTILVDELARGANIWHAVGRQLCGRRQQ